MAMMQLTRHVRRPVLGRLLWTGIVSVYAVITIAGLPALVRQHSALTGIALRTGFQEWETEKLRAALDESGLSVSTWTAIRLATDLITALGYTGIALLIFNRRASDRYAFFVSLFLATFGIGSTSGIGALRWEYPTWRAVFGLLMGLPWLAFYVFFYTFPDGRFVPRWMAVGTSLLVLLIIVGSLVGFPSLGPFTFLLIAVMFLSALYSQVHRYRRVSNTVQRAQTRWVVFAIAVIALGEVIGQGLLPALFPALTADGPARLVYSLFLLLGVPLFLLIPASISIAILRYRLFDIDIIIHRTLVYAILTGILGLVYFGGVTLLQSLFAAVSNRLNFVHAQSPLSIVISTLAIAALFNPLRRRVQEFVDRRFYRRKYDAEQAMASFAALAREEVDLEEISARLLSVVEETVQPEHASLWLRPAADSPTPVRFPASGSRQMTAADGGQG